MGITLGYLTSLYGTANEQTWLRQPAGDALRTCRAVRELARPEPGHGSYSRPSRGRRKDIKVTAAQPAVKRAMDAFTAGVTARRQFSNCLRIRRSCRCY